MVRMRIVPLGVFAVVLAACGPGGASTAPTSAATQAAVATTAPTEDACAAANLDTLSPGLLTVGADEPAYPPYYFIDDPVPSGSIWSLGQPPNGKGLESATAYSVAQRLGFTADQVTWVITPFNTAIQPGAKAFDMYLTQVSYSAERAKVVDLSDGYFDLNQAVIGLASGAIA
jgi:polar amino acid transport system substrate-binding protein